MTNGNESGIMEDTMEKQTESLNVAYVIDGQDDTPVYVQPIPNGDELAMEVGDADGHVVYLTADELIRLGRIAHALKQDRAPAQRNYTWVTPGTEGG